MKYNMQQHHCLREALFFLPPTKRILCQITPISECYEADKRCNKAQTMREETNLTARWMFWGKFGNLTAARTGDLHKNKLLRP